MARKQRPKKAKAAKQNLKTLESSLPAPPATPQPVVSERASQPRLERALPPATPRDFSSLRPDSNTHPWRSVRRRQRRLFDTCSARWQPSRFNYVVTPAAIYAVTSSLTAPKPKQYADSETQTPATPPRSNASCQAVAPASDASTQTEPEMLPTTSPERPPPPPSATGTEAHPLHAGMNPADFHARPLSHFVPRGPPPMPPVQYRCVTASEHDGAFINAHSPPETHGPEITPASDAIVTAEALTIVSSTYPSLLHAQIDYASLPPYQKRALLDLHRLLFPFGLDLFRYSAPFALLPIGMIARYLKQWTWSMSRFVRDTGPITDFAYVGGVFVRHPRTQ